MRALNIVKFSAAMLSVVVIGSAAPAFAFPPLAAAMSAADILMAPPTSAAPANAHNRQYGHAHGHDAHAGHAPGHWHGGDHHHRFARGYGYDAYGWGYGDYWDYPGYAEDYGYYPLREVVTTKLCGRGRLLLPDSRPQLQA